MSNPTLKPYETHMKPIMYLSIYIYTLGFQPPVKQRGLVNPHCLLGPKYYSSERFIFLFAHPFCFGRVNAIFQTGRAEVIHRGAKNKDIFQDSTCSFTGGFTVRVKAGTTSENIQLFD